MDYFTPKHHPWKATTGYETVDAYPVPSNPIASQRTTACYIPNGMCTKPLTFPSLVVGYDRNPIHEARTALTIRYDYGKWFENQDSLAHEVASNLKNSQTVNDLLDRLVREKKEKLKAFQNEDVDTENVNNQHMNDLKLKVDDLSWKLKKIILENNKMQDCKRKLQACIRSIEAPLQIDQECLHHREFRDKTELVNDKVEQSLMREIELIRGIQKDLGNDLQDCENELIRGRKMQNDLEDLIKTFQWAIIVDRSPDKIKKLSESILCLKRSDCLSNKADKIVCDSIDFQRRIDNNIKKITCQILKSWEDTDTTFQDRIAEMKNARDEIECYIVKIKNKIFNIEKNLKYLERIDNNADNEDLQKGKETLESLLRTKKNLDMELKSKLHSIFIDSEKCITMRKCFPISIITNQ